MRRKEKRKWTRNQGCHFRVRKSASLSVPLESENGAVRKGMLKKGRPKFLDKFRSRAANKPLEVASAPDEDNPCTMCLSFPPVF
jgi:hypothetical protein